jgi:hypothetical protein
MKLSGELHITAPLPALERTLVPTRQNAELAPEPLWALDKKDILTPDRN